MYGVLDCSILSSSPWKRLRWYHHAAASSASRTTHGTNAAGRMILKVSGIECDPLGCAAAGPTGKVEGASETVVERTLGSGAEGAYEELDELDESSEGDVDDANGDVESPKGDIDPGDFAA